MAQKRFKAQIPAVNPDDDVEFQRVTFRLNGETVDTQTIGPDGGEIFSKSFDVPDNQNNVFDVLVSPVDFSGQPSPEPAIGTKTLKGADTIPPRKPDTPPTFEIVEPGVDNPPPPEGAASAPRTATAIPKKT